MMLGRIWPALVGAALLLLGHRALGWPGGALAAGALLMWLLLHLHRTMHTLQRAARRPLGLVDSAVMLHSRLEPGQSLLHVIALTRSLGQRLSEPDSQPEQFLWRDGSGSSVTCVFGTGKLLRWELVRAGQRPGPEGGMGAGS